MWYFIPGHTEKVALLARNKLSAAPMEIQMPNHLEGIGFPEEDAPKIIEVLGLTGTPEKKSTDIDGIVLLVFPGTIPGQGAPKPSVEICSWEGCNDLKRYFADVLKSQLLPVVNKRIDVFVPHGSRVAPGKDDIFRVFIYSSCPENNKDMVETPKTIFRTNVRQTAPSFAPCGEPKENFFILDDFSGYVAAELIGNNLYILHDVCHQGTSEELDIFKEIVHQTAEYLSLSEEDRSKKTS